MAQSIVSISFFFVSICILTRAQDTKNIETESSPTFCKLFFEELDSLISIVHTKQKSAIRIGIASLALGWIPILPSIPLGISAIIRGKQCDTSIVNSGISGDNWKNINAKCAELLKRGSVITSSIEDRCDNAIIFGVIGIVLAILSAFVTVLFRPRMWTRSQDKT